MSRLFLAAVATTTTLTATPGSAAVATPLEGRWSNLKGSVVVLIAPCGRSLCGRIVHADAKARRSAAEGGNNNLIGTTILSDIVPAGAHQWKARIFLPKQNTHVAGNLRLTGRQMIVRGCLMRVICKDQTWARAG
jgi:uncharacterized protein (DUF2147 family)